MEFLGHCDRLVFLLFSIPLLLVPLLAQYTINKYVIGRRCWYYSFIGLDWIVRLYSRASASYYGFASYAGICGGMSYFQCQLRWGSWNKAQNFGLVLGKAGEVVGNKGSILLNEWMQNQSSSSYAFCFIVILLKVSLRHCYYNWNVNSMTIRGYVRDRFSARGDANDAKWYTTSWVYPDVRVTIWSMISDNAVGLVCIRMKCENFRMKRAFSFTRL